MKTNIKKIISIAVAGKISVSANMAGADGLGKAPAEGQTSAGSLSLDQIGYPLQVLTPPNVGLDNGSKSPEGTIFAGDTGKALNSGVQPRIDFVINNIQSQNDPVVVFLAYSTVQGSPTQWQDVPLAGLYLNRDTTHIISAFQLDPLKSFDIHNVTSSPLGSINNEEGNSVVVSLNLADLSHPEFDSGHIYFQAVAIPLVNGQFMYAQATVSELDHYKISREIANQEGTGSKLTDPESVVAQTISDTSSKAGGTDGQSGSKNDSDGNDTGSKNTGSGDTGGK